jgi:hypothetical protein
MPNLSESSEPEPSRGGRERIGARLAAELLLNRRRLRESLAQWCVACGYEPALHHQLLIARLEAVARGEVRRLAVFMPPGSAKSTYASILFPPWFLARTPRASIIAASHTTELAEKWGRRVRNLVVEHSTTLGIALAADSQAAGRWALASGGEYYAAGVGVGIAGFRADLVAAQQGDAGPRSKGRRRPTPVRPGPPAPHQLLDTYREIGRKTL